MPCPNWQWREVAAKAIDEGRCEQRTVGLEGSDEVARGIFKLAETIGAAAVLSSFLGFLYLPFSLVTWLKFQAPFCVLTLSIIFCIRLQKQLKHNSGWNGFHHSLHQPWKTTIQLLSALQTWPTIAIWLLMSCFTNRRYYDYVPLPSATKDRPLLWIGGMPLPWQIRDMRTKGVTAIVNMCEEFPGHESLYADLGIEQCWLPTTDYCNVTAEVIGKGVAFIHRKIQAGDSVYVHCKSGIGRCAMVLVTYLAKHQHMSIEDANRWAKDYRPALIGDVGKRPGVIEFLENEKISSKIN